MIESGEVGLKLVWEMLLDDIILVKSVVISVIEKVSKVLVPISLVSILAFVSSEMPSDDLGPVINE